MLWGFDAQTDHNFEIVIADDGSREETRQLIERFARATDRPVQHIWQADDGFQKCRILNKAILEVETEYVVFTDGDCIPHENFVRDHRALASDTKIITGPRVDLSLTASHNQNTNTQEINLTLPTMQASVERIYPFAKREGDEYVVNGQKVWTSRAEHSDLMLLLARTTPKDEVTKRTDGLSVFLVDLRKSLNHGVTIRPISTMINHATTEVFIDDLRIPAEQRIGEEGKGFRYILDGMNAERILIGAECIGDSRWFIQKASEYAKDRTVFQRPIGQNQGIQFPIAKAYAQSEAADLMVRKAASLFDSGKPCGKEANMAKLLAADASWEAADVCLQTHGGFGFAEEYDIERKFRETRLYRIAPVSTNLILSYLAEHVLGLPRSF